MDYFSTLLLLVWKNYLKQKREKFNSLCSIFLPSIIAFIIVSLRYLTDNSKLSPTTRSFDPVNFTGTWDSLVHDIAERRISMLKEQSTFVSNVYIPRFKVGFAPNKTLGIYVLLAEAMDNLDQLASHIEGFSDCAEMRQTAFSVNYMASICFHNIDETINGLPQKLNFSIIFPSEFRLYKQTWLGNTWQTSHLVASLFQPDFNAMHPISEGVVSLQYFISLAYLRTITTHSSLPAIKLKRMDERESAEMKVIGTVKVEIVLCLMVAYIYPVFILTKQIVEERQVKQHILIGLDTILRKLQLFSWFFNGFGILMLASLLLTMSLKIKWNGNTSGADKCPLKVMILFLTTCSMSVVSFCILLAILLRTTRNVAAFLPMFWLLTPLPFLIIDKLDSVWLFKLVTLVDLLLCNVNLSRGILKMVHFEEQNQNIGSNEYMSIVSVYTENSINLVITFFIMQTMMYLVLAFFLESDVMTYMFRLPLDLSILRHFEKIMPTRLVPMLGKRITKATTAHSIVSKQRTGTLEQNDKLPEQEPGQWKSWMKKQLKKTVYKHPPPEKTDRSRAETDQPKENDKQAESTADDMTERKDHNLFQLLTVDETPTNSFYLYFIDSDYQMHDSSSEVEPDSKTSEHPVVIEFDNVWKKYSRMYVVRHFTLKVRQGEIFVLLGSNASGKTTILNMMCGLIKPSHGKIYINGLQIAHHPNEAFVNIEASLHDVVMFPHFTVREHLFYLCRMRGLTEEEATMDTDSYMQAMGITQIGHISTSKITNGQMRILLMLCAFAGRRKIVLLDKPMECVNESYVQRFYEFVLSQQKDRTIFITTNAPKVASNIAGRVGIICDGKMQCCLPIAELYEKYRDGYRLDCLIKETCNIEMLRYHFSRTVPNIRIESQLVNRVVFFIPHSMLENLTELLDQLLTDHIALYLKRYSVSESHLDNIFINLVMHAKFKKSIFYKDALQGVANEMRSFEDTKWILSQNRNVRGWVLFLKHVHVILQKRFLVDIRHWEMPLLQIFLPGILALWTLSVLSISTASHSEMLPPFAYQFESFHMKFGVILSQVLSTNMAVIGAANRFFALGNAKTLYGKFESVQLDPGTDIMTFILDEDMDENVLSNTEFIIAALFKDDEITALFNGKVRHSSALALAQIMDAVAKSYVSDECGISVTFDPLPYSVTHGSHGVNSADLGFIVTLSLCYTFLWALGILNISMQKTNKLMQIEKVAGLPMRTLYASSVAYSLIKITLSLLPLNAIITIFNTNRLITWQTHFAFLYVIFIIALCKISIHNLLIRCVNDAFRTYIIVLIFSSLSIISFQGMCHFFEYTEKLIPFLDISPINSLALNLMRVYNVSDLLYICSDEQTLTIIVNLEQCLIQPNCCDRSYDHFSIIAGMWKAYVLILMSWVLVWAIEGGVTWKKPQREDVFDSNTDSCYDNYVLHMLGPTERDMTWINEKIRVRTLERGRIKDKALFVEDFGVFLDSRPIVNRLNFIVEQYQTVALLGGHGSGKTVLMQALVGIRDISRGEVYCNSLNAEIKGYQNIGFSSQDERIVESLNVVEVFKLILLIRGLKAADAETEAFKLCKVFDLHSHRYHMLENCSRGIIKRLSIAIAIISSRTLTLLDDPFTYLDVSSRRVVYNLIQRICNSGQSVVYASSDTKRCDLAHRMIILKDTGICAIGDEIELMRIAKSTHFKVSVKIHVQNYLSQHKQLVANTQLTVIIRNYLLSIFPEAIIKSFFYHTITFLLPNDVYSVSEILTTLEEHKNENEIYSFYISPQTVSMMLMDIEMEPKREVRMVEVLE